MKPDQIRSLIRLGLHVGLAMEHGGPLVKVDEMVETLAVPIIQNGPTVSRAELGLPETCGVRWYGKGDAFGTNCPGGCECVLAGGMEHGDVGDDETSPHICRRGHLYRRPV